jgi:hypothetical protein
MTQPTDMYPRFRKSTCGTINTSQPKYSPNNDYDLNKAPESNANMASRLP